MDHLLGVDWRAFFVPTVGLLELVLRASVIYLGILAALRIFRRDAGSLNMADLLVAMLVADAAQNALASSYDSVTEGLVLVGTIFGWSHVLDRLAYKHAWISRLLHASPLLLVVDGRLQRRNLRAEFISQDELNEQLRKQGIERLEQVKRCYLEPDGGLSVIRADGGGR